MRDPLEALVDRSRRYGTAVVRTIGTDADPASHREDVATDLVQAYAGFLDLVAAGHQVEQTRPLADSTKAMLDALVTTDASAFKAAYESMRLSLIAWVDRNGWNHN
ncbi:MAG: hypothetical protein KGJ77_01385 [Acidobacteriota bacterium]|nr:hypothetical protein [Acidobacteriota bacterium]